MAKFLELDPDTASVDPRDGLLVSSLNLDLEPINRGVYSDHRPNGAVVTFFAAAVVATSGALGTPRAAAASTDNDPFVGVPPPKCTVGHSLTGDTEYQFTLVSFAVYPPPNLWIYDLTGKEFRAVVNGVNGKPVVLKKEVTFRGSKLRVGFSKLGNWVKCEVVGSRG